MPKRYLLTGCSGFLGFHLAQFLVRKGHRVFGTYWQHRLNQKGVQPVLCDFKNPASVKKLVKKTRPDVAFHLAGQSNIPHSWKYFEDTFQTNVFGTYYLLEALRVTRPDCRVVIAGSSSEYGPVKDKKIRLSENHLFRPTNPYALSKVGEDLLGWVYHHSFGMRVLRVIPFYVVGPRKERDAPSDFAKSLVRFHRGQMNELKVGNISVIRDLIDVRDAIRALHLITEKGEPGTSYNLCTGKEISLEKILCKMMALAGVRMKVTQDPKKLRVGDETRIVGDPTRLKGLGWRPKHSLDETLQSVLDYWKENLKD